MGSLLAIVPPAHAKSATDKRAEAKQIAAKLADLQQEQMELGATYERANYERHLADEKAIEAQAQADETSAELDIRRAELRNFAVSAYQGGNDAPTAAALLSDAATSGTIKRFYLETTTGDRGDLIDALKSAQLAAEADVERLNEPRAEADSYVAEIESARSAAAEATQKQDALFNARVQGELESLVAEEAAAYAARNPVTAPVAATAGTIPPPGTAPVAGSPDQIQLRLQRPHLSHQLRHHRHPDRKQAVPLVRL